MIEAEAAGFGFDFLGVGRADRRDLGRMIEARFHHVDLAVRLRAVRAELRHRNVSKV